MLPLLEEEQCKSLPEDRRVLYVLQWLQSLPQAIRTAPKGELKSKQNELVRQLCSQLQASVGPPLRKCLGRAFVALYGAGETFTMHDTVGRCCDIVRSKEEGLPTNKLTAIECLGSIFQHHGRMAGTLFPETVQVLTKAMKMQELRSEILDAFCRLLVGLGPSSASAHKDIYKCVRNGLGDKSMSVRSAAARCALELSQHSTFLYSQELDSFSNICLRALDGSSYEVRCAVAHLLGSLLSLTQKPLPPAMRGKLKLPSLEEALTILSNGFVRGGSGFLKAGGPELLKGGVASRETRVGVTQAYVMFLEEMGGVWVERHLSTLTQHILDLVSHPKTISTHIDAVYSRKCVSFILRSVFGRLLGESAQFVAARHLCQFICQTVSPKSVSVVRKSDNGSSEKQSEGTQQTSEKDRAVPHHMVICSILEIGALVYSLNTAALSLVIGEAGGVASTDLAKRQPPLIAAVGHIFLLPSLAARLAGAWCMHCIGLALPSQLSALVDHCLVQLQGARESMDTVSGYSHAIASLLATVRCNELGIPSAKAKEVFTLGQELISARTKNKEPDKLALTHIQSGWALIGAYISLGPVHVQSQLRLLVSMWRASFPRSMKELSSEQAGGSLHSWLAILENRAGALSSICSFLKFCGDLLTPEFVQRIMMPLDSALAMLPGLPGLAKAHGVQLRAGGALLRLRLYQALVVLTPTAYEGSLSPLLRELVTEFTLTDNLANTTTSLLRSMCHHDDSILLGSWLEETDHQDVEEQLQLNSAAGSGALEHDPSCVYITSTRSEGTRLPGPLPLGVAVIDTSITLFGRAFPYVAQKHRQQLLSHFRECIRQAKGVRQQAIQINIFTAFLSALKNLVEAKAVLGQQELLTNAYGLIAGALASSEPMLRCAAGEALGRMSQVGGEANLVAQIAQTSFDTLKTTKEAVSRMGHSLVLGCLHRYVGGMGSGQHLQTSVTILHSLTRDTSSPTVQVWALHALVLIADSGGPMFRNYVEPTLTLLLTLLVTMPSSCVEVHQCLGKCLSSLITTLGPELQDSSQSMNTTRNTCLTCCAIIQEHPDSIVQSAAIGCLQQLQLFAPKYVTLASIIPKLCGDLDSRHLLLRRAAANCLRQFTQREPKTVWSVPLKGAEGMNLEHLVLSKLDIESDPKLCEDLREILFSLLTSLAPEDPMHWLLLCNSMLSASSQKSPTELGERATLPGGGDIPVVEDEDEDMAKFTTGEAEESKAVTKISPRWPTKVFAVECSRKIYAVCKSDPAHFDLTLAQKRKRERGGDYLVMHLSELVRTSFIAATASVDQLKMAGYEALRDVIELFAAIPDPDFQGHVLLEQYQAQIGAALRPAFASDTAPHVTAMACQVCSEWLGSGVSRDVSDLKRVQQLLVSSLERLLRGERQQTSLYGEAVATMEALAVLKAWAELYIKVSEDSPKEPQKGEPGGAEGDSQTSGAVELLDPHLPSLSQYWLAALKDHAYLSLPPQFSSQLPSAGGTFYSTNVMESVKPYYEANWPSLLHAAATWLESRGLKESVSSVPSPFPVGSSLMPATDPRHDWFHLVLGLAVQSLCTPATLDHPLTVLSCLHGLRRLLSSEYSRGELAADCQLAIETLSVFHRLLLTCQSHTVHVIVLEIATLVGNALQHAASTKTEVEEESEKGRFKLEAVIEPGKSCVYSLLEVSACCLLRLIPDLKPKELEVSSSVITAHHPGSPSKEELNIITRAISILVTAVSLCTPHACVHILPSVLHMFLSTLKYTSTLSHNFQPTSNLQSLRQLCAMLPLSDEHHGSTVRAVLQSALATVLGVEERGETEKGSLVDMEEETKLMVVAILLHIPTADICPAPSELFDGCVRLFKQCLQSTRSKLQLKALQTCKSLFAMKDSVTSTHFIHTLGPEMVRVVEGEVRDAGVVVEATQVLETLLDLTPEQSKAQMLGLLLPLLVSALAVGSSATKHQKLVHDHVLQRLMEIGPKYPVAFRAVMQNSPGLKQQLEEAIRVSQSSAQTPSRVERARQQPHTPSIKLKMDFSNFK